MTMYRVLFLDGVFVAVPLITPNENQSFLTMSPDLMKNTENHVGIVIK